MRKIIFLLAAVLPGVSMFAEQNPQWLVGAPVTDIRAELEQTPEKSGGIYYAYPVTSDQEVAVPEGFEPVFLTHYGRHGSRWCLKDYQYPMIEKFFEINAEKGNLTELGADVQRRLKRVSAHAAGHEGELSPLGERQHKAIAGRMAARFPELFADSMRVEARSSQVQRCILSMAAFTERLKEINPTLRVQRYATPSDMGFIAYDSPEASAIARRDAPWHLIQNQMRDSLVQPQRLMASLFVNPDLAVEIVGKDIMKMYGPKPKNGAKQPEIADKKGDKKAEKKGKAGKGEQFPAIAPIDVQRQMMKTLHDIAVDIQDVDGLEDVTLLDVFTAEELFNLWQMLNLDMYVRHANAEQGHRAGINSARSMLNRFLTVSRQALVEADSLAAAGEAVNVATPVKLHFGHDTNLIRLCALMGIEGCDRQESRAPLYCEAWQDFRVSPMGANVQLVFFRNPQGRTLVLVRHNEQNASLPIAYAAEGAPFYDWADVEKFWSAKIAE